MARHVRQVPISSKNSRSARVAHARASREFRTYDTSAIRPKQSKAPLVILLLVIAIAVCLVFTTVYFFFFHEDETLPADQQAIVVVENGESAKEVAAALFNADLIGNENRFMDIVDAQDAGGSIIPGTYLFTGGMTMEEILDCLIAGPESTADKLTVPEGATRAMIADSIAEATYGRITAQQFLDATADASVYAKAFEFLETAEDNPLEGFLFPKTYSITATDDVTSVVKMMLDQFGLETDDLDMSYPEARGLDLYDIVILASIVEKEGTPDTYKTVASVFYNRLASDNPYLQSDATTAYEVGHDPTGDEVHADTPYSTYAHAGLPPTPICNPSLEAIQAVCDPDNTNYMYFYTYDDGTYAFSETYEEHQDAIPE